MKPDELAAVERARQAAVAAARAARSTERSTIDHAKHLEQVANEQHDARVVEQKRQIEQALAELPAPITSE